MRGPDFIGIGAPKAGTSWVTKHLQAHPQVDIPVKETHFFSRDALFAQGREHYESLFAGCRPMAKVGEFSPNYLSKRVGAERIAAWYPQARLLVVLRNPIQRAYSHYLHEIRAGQASVEDGFIESAKTRSEYLLHGFYCAHLTRYYEFFDRSQVLVLLYEELTANPADGIRRIYDFIGVDPEHPIQAPDKRINESRVPRSLVVERGLDRARKAFALPFLRPLRSALMALDVPKRVRSLNTSRTARDRARLTEPEKRFLRETYSTDVADLAKLMGRPLHVWPEFAELGTSSPTASNQRPPRPA